MTNEEFKGRKVAHDLGYHYECTCGELYKTVSGAVSCRKCRTYSIWGYCKYVTETLSGVVVYGNLPTREEEKAQEKIAEARWEEERAEQAFQMAMYMKEGELYELEMERRRKAEEMQRSIDELDFYYAIQDDLMGIA